MKIFTLPEKISAFLFDMDSTLYTHEEYARTQIELPIKRLAEQNGKTFEEMNALIAESRERWAAEHGGQKASLGNIFRSFGISIEESVRWREELYEPEKYLHADPALLTALEGLSSSYKLAVVTNNPVSIAVRTLDCLSIRDLFAVIVGLDTCLVSKPHEAPFLKAAELLGFPPSECVSVGDRYDIDIALPLDLGMGGVLVDGVDDVRSITQDFPLTIRPA
jgi:phosphoglycolate phosphatase/putative hydrolase of the HAD superfamily